MGEPRTPMSEEDVKKVWDAYYAFKDAIEKDKTEAYRRAAEHRLNAKFSRSIRDGIVGGPQRLMLDAHIDACEMQAEMLTRVGDRMKEADALLEEEISTAFRKYDDEKEAAEAAEAGKGLCRCDLPSCDARHG